MILNKISEYRAKLGGFCPNLNERGRYAKRHTSVTIGRIIPFLLCAVVPLRAASVIQAVTDAASYAPRVSPGSMATIFGTGLANTKVNASTFPLPSTLGGAAVFISQSSTTTQAPLIYASPTQINFQVPSRLVAGIAAMYVTLGGGRSLVFNFSVVAASPGIFQDSNNHAIAQNPGNSMNSSSNPASGGAVVVVYLTGQGPVDNPVADGTPAPTTPLARVKATATATIGGVDAPVQFLGLSPGFAGLAQANIQIPTLATGDYPLVITSGGYVSASALISVSGSGTAPPTFLSQAGRLNFGNDRSSSVAIYGNTTYICGQNRINVIDTSNVSAPGYLGEFGDADLNGNGGKCTINSSTATPILVDIVGPGTSPTFVVYNIATPSQPVKLGQIAPQQYTFLADLTFVGSVGFSSTSWYTFDASNRITSQTGDFLAFDFSALLPQLVSAVVPNSQQPASNNQNVRPNALALPPSFQLVYVASSTATGSNTSGSAALDVIDVSSVLSMQARTRVTVSQSNVFLGFAYDNRLLFLAGNTAGVPNFAGNLTLTTMDVTNVPVPVPITTVVTKIATTGTFNVQPFGSSVFAIVNQPPGTDPTGPGSLMIVDARDNTNPLLYPVQTQFGYSGIATANNFFLVPDQNGLTIYKISIPSS